MTIAELIAKYRNDPRFSSFAAYSSMIPDQNQEVSQWVKSHPDLYHHSMVPDSVRQILSTEAQPRAPKETKVADAGVPLPRSRPSSADNKKAMLFLPGQSWPGEKTNKRIIEDARRVAESKGLTLEVGPSGDTPAKQRAWAEQRLKAGGVGGVLGFSAGGNTAGHLNVPKGVEKIIVGAPKAKGNQSFPGKHVDQVAGLTKVNPRIASAVQDLKQHGVNASVAGDPFGYLNQYGAHSSVVKNGRILNAPLGSGPGFDAEFASRLAAAGQAYQKQTGLTPKYGEGDRGSDVQKVYYDRYKSGRGGLAAPPGRSRHQRGMADDLPDSGFARWLQANKQANARQYGLVFPLGPKDPNHIQMDPHSKLALDTGFVPGQSPQNRMLPPGEVAPIPQHSTTLADYAGGSVMRADYKPPSGPQFRLNPGSLTPQPISAPQAPPPGQAQQIRPDSVPLVTYGDQPNTSMPAAPRPTPAPQPPGQSQQIRPDSVQMQVGGDAPMQAPATQAPVGPGFSFGQGFMQAPSPVSQQMPQAPQMGMPQMGGGGGFADSGMGGGMGGGIGRVGKAMAQGAQQAMKMMPKPIDLPKPTSPMGGGSDFAERLLQFLQG